MFKREGMYLYATVPGQMEKFVARFKYPGPISMGMFKKELIANHTVEDYFEALNNEDFSKRKAPLQILRDKNPEWYDESKAKWLEEAC